MDEQLLEILTRGLAYQSQQFDGPASRDLSVSGADIVDWFTQWRLELRNRLLELGEDVPHTETTRARELVLTLLNAGFLLSVFDGEEYPVKKSSDAELICANLGATDEERLAVWREEPVFDEHEKPKLSYVGSIYLVWGNAKDGSELIADHSVQHEITEICNRISGIAQEQGRTFWQIGDVSQCVEDTISFGDGTSAAWKAKLDEGFTHYAQSPNGDTRYFRSEDEACAFQMEG